MLKQAALPKMERQVIPVSDSRIVHPLLLIDLKRIRRYYQQIVHAPAEFHHLGPDCWTFLLHYRAGISCKTGRRILAQHLAVNKE